MRKVNQAGIDLIKSYESFQRKAYLCPAGKWTVGYGHTRNVRPGMIVSELDAEQLLREDLAMASIAVTDYINAPLNDNQFAALVSFTFNVGNGALKGSTLRRKLNEGRYNEVPKELIRWTKATDPKTGQKVTLRGLTSRRLAEAALFCKEMGDAQS